MLQDNWPVLFQAVSVTKGTQAVDLVPVNGKQSRDS